MEVRFDYEPREQFVPFHHRTERWSCLVAHRRCGKTVATINDMIARALYCEKRRPRFAYIAPYYRQAKDVAWDYLKYYAGDAAVKVRESSLSVELFNGALITLYGADNPDALRGIYNDGVILDEFGDCRPSLWGEVVLPTLADRKGWAVFIGTPRGKNEFYRISRRSEVERGWFHTTLRASETGIIDLEELRELRAQMDEDQYLQEFECSFEAAVKGTYYTAILNSIRTQGHMHMERLYDPEFPVEVASDLGYSDSTAFWFWQYRPDGIAVIDYEEDQGKSLDHYFKMLRTKHYRYETIWLPHDARAKTLQTGRSTIEQFLEADFPVRIGPQLKVQHGIDAVRQVLPFTHFDEVFCRDGLEALAAYRRRYDENKKAFADKPLHDWSSNGSDAFRGLALVAKERLKIEKPTQPGEIMIESKPVGFTLNQLYEHKERNRHAGRRRI